MKLNKNSTLAFIGGIMLASSASMFAANTIGTANVVANSTTAPCNEGRGGRGKGYDGIMGNMTETERQAMKDKMDSNLAQILGISKETLQAKRAASTTMAQMIKDAGLTEEQFHTRMDALRKADMEKALADQVASGKITQARADEIKAKMAKRDTMKKSHTGNASSTAMKGQMKSGWFH